MPSFFLANFRVCVPFYRPADYLFNQLQGIVYKASSSILLLIQEDTIRSTREHAQKLKKLREEGNTLLGTCATSKALGVIKRNSTALITLIRNSHWSKLHDPSSGLSTRPLDVTLDSFRGSVRIEANNDNELRYLQAPVMYFVTQGENHQTTSQVEEKKDTVEMQFKGIAFVIRSYRGATP